VQYVLRRIVREVLLLALTGCGSSVQTGLANAPALGKVPTADERVTDVVANGHDACERNTGPGPLRDQTPPCSTVEEQGPTVRISAHPSGTTDAGADEWLEHYWRGWPCPREPYCAIP